MFDRPFLPQPATPEHVVEQNQSVCADPRQHEFIIRLILALGRVNERKIKGQPALQLLQILDGRPETKLNLLLNTRARPMSAGDGRPFRARVQAEQSSSGGQSARDANGTVTRECSDLD